MKIKKKLGDTFKKALSGDSKVLDKHRKTAKKVLDLDQKYTEFSDEELKNETKRFKSLLESGATLDDIKVEAYAVAREAAYRVLGLKAFEVQIIGGLILHEGDIAEMRTGEGKTLTAVMPAYLNALEEKGVYIVTANEYLVQRDAEEMGKVYSFLGLTTGCNIKEKTTEEKKELHKCDIIYTTNSELGFDYLRDNAYSSLEARVLRGLNFALIDEVDSILIDDARTPLIISGPPREGLRYYEKAQKFYESLNPDDDLFIDIRDQFVGLRYNAQPKADKWFGVENIYSVENDMMVHCMNNALYVNTFMNLDVDYVIDEENQTVIIVDKETGRLQHGRHYNNGIHQAILAKHELPIAEEQMTIASVTYQNFFRMFNKLSGMTGTAKTEEFEFTEIYNMRVLEVPTNLPIKRIDKDDLVYGTKRAKFEALVSYVEFLHKKGQPVLLGTVAVETSELISKMLDEKGLPHEVLNAKNHAREAEIIEKAGKKGSITVSTNMAGRGTDIKIDDEVRSLGGLAVLGSERHESRRIDNQLRGRSGRQGDPGFSQFFVSFQDDLMLQYGSERFEAIFKNIGDKAVSNPKFTKQVQRAQERVESVNYLMRKTVLDYDNVVSEQRIATYEIRDEIIKDSDQIERIEGMFRNLVNGCFFVNYEEKTLFTESEILDNLKRFGVQHNPENLEPNDIFELNFKPYADNRNKVEDKEALKNWEKRVLLYSLDYYWTRHIDAMEILKRTVQLHRHGKQKPFESFLNAAYGDYEELAFNTAWKTVSTLLKTDIVESFKKRVVEEELLQTQ